MNPSARLSACYGGNSRERVQEWLFELENAARLYEAELLPPFMAP